MVMDIICTQDELVSFCQQIENDSFITLDTEFIREKTYFPNLCLLQIAGDNCSAIIDPLAEGMDLQPVFALLQNEKLVKVFHACRQDIEIFFLLSGELPCNIFDTQIAASMCGYGETVSYENLVNNIVGCELDKSSRFSDWSRRPLSERQLEYAISDVTHLRTIYINLKERLEKAGRLAWVMEEHSHLLQKETYQVQPEQAWERIRYGNLRPRSIAALRELANYREAMAKKNNMPRIRIMKDETLIELAKALPAKHSELSRIRDMERKIFKTLAKDILACIRRVMEIPASELPQPNKNKKIVENSGSSLAMLQLLLKVKSEEQGIATNVLAVRDDLEACIAGEENCKIMNGWRYDVFGKYAQKLLSGKLKLYLEPDSKKVVFEDATSAG